MGQQRYSPEFKDEAVRQVTERGYPVQEVAARIGVSAHSLYKWVRAVKPNPDEKQNEELLESKRENLTLRAKLRRAEEERDISEKPPRTLQGNPSKVRVHQRTSARACDCAHVPGSRCGAERLLRVGSQAVLGSSDLESTFAASDPGIVRRQWWYLRVPPHLPRPS